MFCSERKLHWDYPIPHQQTVWLPRTQCKQLPWVIPITSENTSGSSISTDRPCLRTLAATIPNWEHCCSGTPQRPLGLLQDLFPQNAYLRVITLQNQLFSLKESTNVHSNIKKNGGTHRTATMRKSYWGLRQSFTSNWKLNTQKDFLAS